jgi:hypothetical protein
MRAIYGFNLYGSWPYGIGQCGKEWGRQHTSYSGL